jgi:hypothetical protein
LHLRSSDDALSRQMIITVGASDRFWPERVMAEAT